MKNYLKKNTEKGFTLIELILVIALLGISVTITNDILVSLIRSNNKTQVINEIEQQANFVSLKIEKELRNARVVNEPLATDINGGKTLIFLTRDGSTIQYDVDTDTGVMSRTLNGGTKYNLTSNAIPGGVLVSCGSPNCFSVLGYNPQIINMNINFNQAQPTPTSSYTGSISIKSTVVIRNTY